MYISVLQRVKNLRHAKGFLSFFLANCLHCQWQGKRVQREVKKCVSVFTWVYVCVCACVYACVCLSFKYFNFVSNSLRAAAAATTTLMIVSQPCWHFNFTLCFISTFSYTHMYVCYVCVCIYFMLFSSLLFSTASACFVVLLSTATVAQVCIVSRLFIYLPTWLPHTCFFLFFTLLSPLSLPPSPLSVTFPSSVSISV